MDLHQIQVIYQPEDDRILCRASFKDSDGSLQEVRAWLTRRLVRNLWPSITDALETQVSLDKPQAAHASADIVGMEHHACVEEITDSGSFNNPYDVGIQTYPLGETPILIQTVNFAMNPGQPIRMNLAAPDGNGFEIAFAQNVLHGFCSLLRDAVKAADWDMELVMPGATTMSPATRVLN